MSDREPGASAQPDRSIRAHPERARRIRAWHIERATGEARPVAVCAIHVMDDGTLQSQALGVEIAFAQLMANELRALADALMARSAERPRQRRAPTLTRVK